MENKITKSLVIIGGGLRGLRRRSPRRKTGFRLKIS